MVLTPLAAVVIGLVLVGWTAAAALLVLRSGAQVRRARRLESGLRRLQHMLDVAPAVPMLVRVDGRIEAPDRLARWFGFGTLPESLSELAHPSGLSQEQVAELELLVRQTQKSAKPFKLSMMLPGIGRSLAFHGTIADTQVSPGGAALVWVFDFSESEAELAHLRRDAARARGDFAALIGLIEAAPVPMWFRDSEMTLQLVNRAYVEAVGAASAEAVVQGQMELLDAENGRTPATLAFASLDGEGRTERITAATIRGERRTFRVNDLPLPNEGVAGYAIDIEEQQQVRRQFRAYRNAQRAMLDQLSIGVAQFDEEEALTFANLPFRRLFELGQPVGGDGERGLSFERFLADARERGRTPEVRDFPEWRRERARWFDGSDTQEENWPLPGGTHLRIVAQPLPDGGLVFIAEDRTESLALSATRDILLRTRTATLDSLFEALAIFAPDGSVQLWNRSFAGTWGLTSEFLDTRPGAQDLLDAIAQNLADPQRAEDIGASVRSATLDRRSKTGLVELIDGRTLRFAGVPLPDGNGLLTVLDITDSQKAEKALRERAQALEEADEVKTRFLANMSYEFRTPLTTISGFAEMLASGAAGRLNSQARDYVDAILLAAERLTQEVENVLDLSQSQAGLLPIAKEDTDLVALLTALVREREEAIVQAGLGLDLKGRRGRIATIDPRQLGRALGHVLDNAIEHTDEGGQIMIEVRRGDPEQDWSATIIISDDGKGMSDRELAIASGAVPEDASKSEMLSGLGIPLARQLVEAHDGTFTITSEAGVGTQTTIQLP